MVEWFVGDSLMRFCELKNSPAQMPATKMSGTFKGVIGVGGTLILANGADSVQQDWATSSDLKRRQDLLAGGAAHSIHILKGTMEEHNTLYPHYSEMVRSKLVAASHAKQMAKHDKLLDHMGPQYAYSGSFLGFQFTQVPKHPSLVERQTKLITDGFAAAGQAVTAEQAGGYLATAWRWGKRVWNYSNQ